MNNISKTIGWADVSWNPIIGCRKGCSYCYAKAMNDRFKFIPNFAEPQFFPERLKEPYKLKKPSKIFVCSMGEIFDGDALWVTEILKVAKDLPQHAFMFLSQKPEIYKEYKFPNNCWLGMTFTYSQYSQYYSFVSFIGIKRNKKYLSIEPILGTFFHINFSKMDLVIVGAMTGKDAIKPKPAWIESIQQNKTIRNIYWKNNIKKYLEGK